MLTTNAHTVAIRSVFSTFDSLSLEPPKPVAEAHQRFTAIVENYERRPNGQGEALALAVIAAGDAGEDPACNSEVQRILAAQMLDSNHHLPEVMAQILMDLTREVVKANSAAIIATWRPVFDTAAKTATEAHAAIHGADLEDTATILRQGPKAADAWAQAQGAVATIAAIQTAWVNLYAFVTGQHMATDHRLLTIANVPATEYHRFAGRPADPWAAIGDGLELSLPTLGDFAKHTALIKETDDKRTAGEMVDQARAEKAALGSLIAPFVEKVNRQKSQESTPAA